MQDREPEEDRFLADLLEESMAVEHSPLAALGMKCMAELVYTVHYRGQRLGEVGIALLNSRGIAAGCS